MKKILRLILLFLFIGNMGFSQTLLLQESFEGGAANYDANTFDDGTNDYFFVMSNSHSKVIGGGGEWPSSLGNVNGTYFFAAEDLDVNDNYPLITEGYIVLSSQNISAYDEVTVIVAFAEAHASGVESPDYIKIQYAFDGNVATAGDGNVNTGSYTDIGAFYPSGIPNYTFQEDTNLNGLADGIELTSTFQDFTYTFSTSGATNVSIRIVLDIDGYEETAVDNIRIYGQSACTDPDVPTVVASPTSVCAGSSSTLTFSGSLNDATAWHIYSGSCGGTSIGNTAGSTFSVSPGSTTTYYVRGEGGCVTPGSCGSVTVTVNPDDDASFNYGAAAYCVDASDPTPTITGLAGGTFSSTAGLSINTSTGTIDVSTSTPNTYTVTYTTAGTCPNSSNVSVTVNSLDDPSFNYSAAAYCVDASDPTPTITGLAGGSFSSTAGLSINTSTGTIDVSTSTPNTYTVTYTTAGTCPNISNQTVTVNPTYNLTETDSVCSGDSYTFPDGTTQNNITAQVIHTSNLLTVATSCDSVIVTTVNVNPVYNLTETDAVCSGDSYTFPDGTTQNNITAQVIHTSNLLTVATSCDSVIVTTVNVNPVYNLTETDAVCSGDSYTFPDGTTQNNITAQVIHTSNLLTVATSCDSVIVTTVNVNPVYNLTETDAVCSGESYTFPDGTTQNNITAQVIHTSNLLTVATSCDSVIVSTVNVNPVYNLTETDAVCSGESYTFPDGTTQNNITAQVIHTSNLLTVATSCDSVIVTTVNVNPVYNLTETDSVCSGDSYTFPDGTTQNNITAQVIHTSNLLTVATSCDSVIVTTVNVTVVNTSITKTGIILTANANATAYQWLDCNNTYAVIPSETNQSFTTTVNGSYAVEITDNGCIDTSSCFSIISVGLHENTFENTFEVYPNPTTSKFTISFENNQKELTVEIYTITGQLIKSRIYYDTNLIQMKLIQSKGMYFVKIINDDGNEAVIKLMKE
jgi:Secretion system C-terminal sorting domain